MLTDWPPFQALAKAFAEGRPCLRVAGLQGAARGIAVAELLQTAPRPALLLVPGMQDAHRWAQDLRFFGAAVVEFPETEPRLWRGGRQREADAERALAARRLAAGEPVVVVATPAALDVGLAAPAEFAARSVRLGVGDRLDRELLLEALEHAGYERVETVVEVGQWSLRGGIVDVFTPAHPNPARLEFLGDDVESIRLFDPTSQRSIAALDELVVVSLAVPEPAAGTGLLDYLPGAAAVVVDTPSLLDAGADEAPARAPLRERLAGRQLVELVVVAGTSGGPGDAPAVDLTLETHAVPQFAGRFAQLGTQLTRWRAEGFRVRLVAQDARQADHLRQILREHDIEVAAAPGLAGEAGSAVLVGECSGGFTIPALGLVVLTEGEIFGARRRSLRRPKYQRGAALTAFTDLGIGDIVVHEDHGLGRYLGLRTMTIGGREGDFLVLEYAEGNQLYLPVERLDLVSKYLGGDEGAAKLDRLGGAAWQRVKEAVRAALREMAEELLRLYARRAVADGHAFSTDAPWQREFEAAFRFEETADQLRAIDDVKGDMQSPRPMDRLVAGDVGYGKTEVALRAAFKAVADGLQVAVLVPTTVLAQQHWSTFADRFAPFPARVELLSRYRSPKEQKAIVEGLRRGTVDVVIGTHRLLSKDVEFKNLGLLVVDEEHRFGVAHKERMKQLRASVDVLALTATPIPRTLYMSLSGVRDMSVIETPPLDRLPVETVIRRFSRAVIKEALERELERGGQVFFVHNRVQSLPTMARFVQELVPDARIIMAHGQMKERELEAAMVRFVTGQADVLVSTAIVESGLDIPASNTIIVNRADRFGLAQLYQLRGRVGRERQQAWAYLLVPADGRVDERAQRRLRALQDLTELGSGFKLALRDLEIRGAGNLLGAQQHGHIAAVGYDLYSKLLAEAVRNLRGEPAAAAVDPVISVPVEGFLAEEYVPEVNQRLALYKRLAGAASDAEVADLAAELADRFGPLPVEAVQLLDTVRIRVAARALSVEKIEAGDGRALITFSPATPLDPERLVRAIQASRGGLRLKREFTVEAVIAGGQWSAVRDSLLRLLATLARA
ncbi:MAG: transcription-repair coupling factor [Candidatus Rokubacteria bacterium]|nr:transcription-repair coupling factor [Candidatus Rokubacteria bacterium]MBI4628150.1 transcription-repair coupling factor [Candidatus Rokubacteria bacterium]